MINKNQINNKAIEATKKIERIKANYGITVDDAAELHKAFAIIHGEHILLETQRVLKETEGMKQPFYAAKFQLEWVVNHLSINFTEPIKRESLAKL